MLARVRQEKVCQSALRHKVRNLRAKVRLLLPAEVCGKDRRRSKNIAKMMRDRGCQKGEDWFVPAPGRRERHMFQKLSKQQIEQIKEDKLYYVGEQYLDQFNNFLQREHGVKQWSKKMAAAGTSIAEGVSYKYGYTPLFHKTTSSNFSSVLRDEGAAEDEKQNRVGTGDIDRRVKNLMRFQSIKQKRKLITEQQMTRKTIIKRRIEEREKLRSNNWCKMTAEKQRSIRQRSEINELRTSESFRMRRNKEGLGQISSLSEKLRRLCLKRRSKQNSIQ